VTRRRTRARLLAAVLWVGGAAFPSGASAEPATLILGSGVSANRLDLVMLGDGYTAAELPKFASDVRTFVGGFFAQQPYAEYAPYFNVHRVDVASEESGASHPELGVSRTTAFSAYYNCGGTLRRICVDISAVNSVLERSLPPESRELVMVLVNDPQYGGIGGAVAVSSTHILGLEVLLHEMGHTLGLLGDEYSNGGTCNNSFEPAWANVTTLTARSAIKWGHWIDDTTPLPTLSTAPALPGLYLGAHYCPEGLHRPTYNSKMRTLNFPFEQVNSEQLVKRIYNFVSPIDSFSPTEATQLIRPADVGSFRVAVPTPSSHALSITWLLDDVPVGEGPAMAIPGTALPTGTHTLRVVVRDPTELVRSDPAGVLQAVHSWTLTGG
jgi:hypothetical protein